MGVIQSSINQALGTGAILSGLAAQAAAQEDAAKLQSVNLGTEIKELEKEIEPIKNDIETLDKQHPEWNNPKMSDDEIKQMQANPDYDPWSKAKDSLVQELQIKEKILDTKKEMYNTVGLPLIQRMKQQKLMKGGKK